MAQPSELEKAILRTLCYADIFDYPLTGKQIYQYLIRRESVPASEIETALRRMIRNQTIGMNNGLFFLKGKGRLAAKRKRRERRAEKSRQIAMKVAAWLKWIPTVKMVSLTGALAMDNSDVDDDIDLMVVAKSNRLWLTRLLVVPLVSLIARRRKPEPLSETPTGRQPATSYKNAICLNLWLDESALRASRNQRNLYTAHEVVQIKPLWSKDGVYEKFMAQNAWIKDHLPNIKVPKARTKTMKQSSNATMMQWIEYLAFQAQLWYMRKRRTRETITPHAAFFHPRDTTKLVLEEYRNRLNRLRIRGKAWEK